MTDANLLAALGREVIYLQWFAWLDIDGDTVRVVSGVQDIAFAANETGDPDLDGQTFIAVPSNLINVSDVSHAQRGSGSVTATLSGLPVEESLLDIVDQRAKWRKREARLWFRVLDPIAYNDAGVPVEFSPFPIQRYYSGYLVNLQVATNATEQNITATIENYQTALSQPSRLTYLDRARFDPNDNSASRKLAASNGIQRAGIWGQRGGLSQGGGRGVGQEGGQFFDHNRLIQ